MAQALALARDAGTRGEVPVGAVIVQAGKVIAVGANGRETRHDATAHAEIIAIAAAGRALGAWRLSGCTLYVTLEPCLMCAGAVYLARLDRVVYGALDPKAGAMGSLYRVHEDQRLNHRLPVTAGVAGEECSALLRAFFQARRRP